MKTFKEYLASDTRIESWDNLCFWTDASVEKLSKLVDRKDFPLSKNGLEGGRNFITESGTHAISIRKLSEEYAFLGLKMSTLATFIAWEGAKPGAYEDEGFLEGVNYHLTS